MAKQLLAVLKQTNGLQRVRVYSTEDRYLEALPAEVPRFVSRSETRTRLANISLNHQCEQAKKFAWSKEQWVELFQTYKKLVDSHVMPDTKYYASFGKHNRQS
jgi:hypothetical protein